MPFSDIRVEHLTKAELLDLVVRTAPYAIVTADAEGAITSFSPAAETMFGYSEAEILGENLTILMPPGHAARHDGYMSRYLDTGEKRIIGIGREVQAKRRDGELFTVELAVGEMITADAHIFTGFLTDVSVRVEAETKARRLQQSLDRLARLQLIGEMGSALAHEVNQPLTAISNFSKAAARALRRDEPDVEKAASYFENVAEQTQRIGEIIRRMRRLVDRGAADMKPDDINDIVREAVRASEIAAPKDAPPIHLDLDDQLPPVLADRVQVQQVVINLLRNAVDAIEEGSPVRPHIATEPARPPLAMRAREDGAFVMVTVSDTGPGIPEDLLVRIFDPLITTKSEGVGVGLAICRSIIHAHGGQIWAENNASGGADVHFTLKAAGSE